MNAKIEALSVNYEELLKEESYIEAYKQQKSNKGESGVEKKRMRDGVSASWIKSTVDEMKTREFKFRPSSRRCILKANGKKRPLGIATQRDKVVQRAIRNVLEPAYESQVFLPTSHGFRPNRGVHTAIESIRGWQGVTWIIEGKINACYESIDQDILGEVLKKRVKDQDILELYRKLVKAGYVESDIRCSSGLGIKKGGVLYPFLSNVYLHELDEYVALLKATHDSVGAVSTRNPVYHNTCNRLLEAVKAYRKSPSSLKLRKIRAERKLRGSLASGTRIGQRIQYVRHADDWMVGVIGPLSFAEEIKSKIARFLAEKLKLELNSEKTLITKVGVDPVYFLNFKIQATSHENWEGYAVKGVKGVQQRKGGGDIKVYAPMENIMKKLASLHLVSEAYSGIAYGKWVHFTDYEIIAKYKEMLLGLYEYYHIVDNPYGLHRIHYVLKYSAAHTLAMKHKSTISKMFTQYGPHLTVAPPATTKGEVNDSLQLVTTKAGSIKNKGVSAPATMALPAHFTTSQGIKNYRKSRKAPMRSNFVDPLEVVQHRPRSHFMFDAECSVCGSTQNVEMHHVKHLKDLKAKKDVASVRMSSLLRKQLPVCKLCHMKIHTGRYDGPRL